MSLAVAVCVCIASTVTSHRTRRGSSFRSSRTHGISLLFSATASWPSTSRAPWANTDTRCVAAAFARSAPRRVLPSRAMGTSPAGSSRVACAVK